ncbi:MAG TPA: DUF2071 domain-containing protein [Streptosporangiaceae bacterium]|nr:DUF2071 domain-containing protein [Streptosporangiaceae bacterium]
MMRLRVRARLDRRILVNYRVDPEVMAAVLPAPFRPVIIDGHAIAGICLIRLGQIRPAGLPAPAGFMTENAAHRFAVRWDTPDGPATGVFVPRRDTDSRLTALAGGRLFPGWHRRARFAVAEAAGQFRLEMTSLDDGARILVAAHLADQVPHESVFADVGTASRFFGCAPVGYSARPDNAAFDGVELDCHGWNLRPLAVDYAASSYFDDVSRFPPGSIALDSAFLMRDLDTTWTALPPLPARFPDLAGLAHAREADLVPGEESRDDRETPLRGGRPLRCGGWWMTGCWTRCRSARGTRPGGCG